MPATNQILPSYLILAVSFNYLARCQNIDPSEYPMAQRCRPPYENWLLNSLLPSASWCGKLFLLQSVITEQWRGREGSIRSGGATGCGLTGNFAVEINIQGTAANMQFYPTRIGATSEHQSVMRCSVGRTVGRSVGLENHSQMTSAKFLGFWTPSTLLVPNPR